MKPKITSQNEPSDVSFRTIEIALDEFLDYNPLLFREKTVLLPFCKSEQNGFVAYFIENFQKLGLRRLICVRNFFAQEQLQESSFEVAVPIGPHQYTNPQVLTISASQLKSDSLGNPSYPWQDLEGDGDDKVEEMVQLNYQADIIIGKPHNNFFQSHFSWIKGSSRPFIIVGIIEEMLKHSVFKHIMSDEIWLGKAVGGYQWLTNIDYMGRHYSLGGAMISTNLRKDVLPLPKKTEYQQYDNYDAIEVSHLSKIPTDYPGVMGVPVQFLNSYCPNEFEILGVSGSGNEYGLKNKVYSREQSENAHKAFILQKESDPLVILAKKLAEESKKRTATALCTPVESETEKARQSAVDQVQDLNFSCVLLIDNILRPTKTRVFIRRKVVVE